MDRTFDEKFFRIVYLESCEASMAPDELTNPFEFRIAVPLAVLHMHSPTLSEIASNTPEHAECVIPLSVVPYNVLTIVVEYMLTHATAAQRADAVGFERANLWGGGSQVKKSVWKRIEDEKDMPNTLLYNVLLCASMCGMAELCSECEYLLCLRITATAFKEKGVPVDDTDTTFERTFGAVPRGF